MRRQSDRLLLPISAQAIEVVGPPLHHLPTLREVLRIVVGGANVVFFAVRELALYGVTQATELRVPVLNLLF